MKIVILILLLTASFDPAHAGDEGAQREVYFGVGISFPVYPQPFANEWNTGYNLGGGLFTSISSIAQFGLGVEYNNFGFDIHKYYSLYVLNSDGFSSTGGSANVILVSPMLKIRFSRAPNKIAGFAVFGIGYFHESTSDLTIYQGNSAYTFRGDSHSAVGVHLGVGVDVPVNEKFGIQAQGEFINGFTEVQSTQYIPVRLGMRLSL